MLFSTSEVLLLEIMTYLRTDKPFTDILELQGKTVGEAMDTINFDEVIEDHDYASLMNGFDWKNIVMAIRRNPRLMECRIAATHYDDAFGGGGGKSAVFLCESTGEAVVAFRGTAQMEWKDDFQGCSTVDSLQQINALEWYKKVYQELGLERYTVTVTGHSKGGNKAKYIAVINDTPARCVSFDGQGFSDQFIMHYQKEILKRQGIIENHNIDFDYVNILLNDFGSRTYYIGYDYGKGGFAEAHCPNTFFNFGENGEYSLQVNPNGQRPEMQVLDQFMNSLARSGYSEKEKNETGELVGALVEKAFACSGDTMGEFIELACEMIGSDKYIDNAAYVAAFCIKYTKEVPEFFDAVQNIMVHFKMDGVLKIIEMLRKLLNSKKMGLAVNLSSILIMRANGLVIKKLQSVCRTEYGVELSAEQLRKVLTVIALTKETLQKLEINMDGSDIVLEENKEEEVLAMPENINIAVLAGGLSNERNRSLKTGFVVADTLRRMGHKVILMDAFMGVGEEEERIENAFSEPDRYSMPQQQVSNDIPDLWAVKKRRKDNSNAYFGPNVLTICRQADLVFNALQGANAENGKIQATFDILGIDYTGCDHFSSALSSNKNISKQIMQNNGINVPKGVCIQQAEADVDPSQFGLSYPLIVKPCNGGIGLGISAVSDLIAYRRALKEAFKWENEVIVEEYVVGREFSVSTISGKAFPVVEVMPSQGKGDYNSDNPHGHECPANIPADLAKTLTEAAEKATKCMGMTSISKADFIVRDDGSYVCLECDSLPELTTDSQIVIAARAAGISYEQLCGKLMEMTLMKDRKRVI